MDAAHPRSSEVLDPGGGGFGSSEMSHGGQTQNPSNTDFIEIYVGCPTLPTRHLKRKNRPANAPPGVSVVHTQAAQADNESTAQMF